MVFESFWLRGKSKEGLKSVLLSNVPSPSQPSPRHIRCKTKTTTFHLRSSQKKKEKKEITERKRNKNRWLVFGRICLFEVKYLTLNVLQHDTGRVLMDLWRVGTISLAPPLLSPPPLPPLPPRRSVCDNDMIGFF